MLNHSLPTVFIKVTLAMVYLTCVIITLITYLFYYFHFLWKRYNYWKVRGVVGPTPIPIIGNYGPVTFKLQAECDFLRKLYEDYPNEKYIGIFKGVVPVLVVRDTAMIKQVLIIDFDSFNSRCLRKSLTAFNKGLFTMNGDESWQAMRRSISPAFSKIKLTKMMPSINQTLKEFLEFIDSEIIDKKMDMEINLLEKKYAIELAGRLIFGVQLNVFSNDDEFQKILARMIKPHEYASSMNTVATCFPDLFSILCPVINNECKRIVNAFSKFIKTLISQRGDNKNQICSLLDHMVEIKEKANISGKETVIDDNAITQQCLTYSLALYFSTANILSFIIHELTNNQNIQNKCYEEILTVFDKYDEELKYDSVFEMKYLYMVVEETMRKYGLSHHIERKCMSKYTFEGENLSIDEDIFVYIPIHGLFHDPKYFPNPEVFDPERFLPENKASIPQCAFIPFGDGPRVCIGSRLGKFIVLVGLSSFLRKFKVVPSNKTVDKLTYNPEKIVSVTAMEGIWVNIERR